MKSSRLNKKDHYQKVFSQTYYIIRDKKIVLKIGQINKKFNNFFLKKNCFFLTAYNPHAKKLSKIVNKKKNSSLMRVLLSHKQKTEKGFAVSYANKWPIEHGYFIFDSSISKISKIAGAFSQIAYVGLSRGMPPKLIWLIS